MLTAFDDYPVHQTALPLAHVGGGHADFYDRFWFNAYREDLYVGVALGRYPNRGILDCAVSVVHDGVQRSVFASGRAPADPVHTAMGPIRLEIIEPMRVNRLVVDAQEYGLEADLTYTATSAVYEEPRQTRYNGSRLEMDVTRATQWGRWSGQLSVEGKAIDLGPGLRGTKDRSWGTRPVGVPAESAPSTFTPGQMFLWAPIHFDDQCFHYLMFEDVTGDRWASTCALIPALSDGENVIPAAGAVEHLDQADHSLTWVPCLRRASSAEIRFHRRSDPEPSVLTMKPLLTFRMKGAGYVHPTWGHGRWHGELSVGHEISPVADLDNLSPENIHVQQVVDVRWGDRRGLGVLEQAVFGPHVRYGFREMLDGAR